MAAAHERSVRKSNQHLSRITALEQLQNSGRGIFDAVFHGLSDLYCAVRYPPAIWSTNCGIVSKWSETMNPSRRIRFVTALGACIGCRCPRSRYIARSRRRGRSVRTARPIAARPQDESRPRCRNRHRSHTVQLRPASGQVALRFLFTNPIHSYVAQARTFLGTAGRAHYGCAKKVYDRAGYRAHRARRRRDEDDFSGA